MRDVDIYNLRNKLKKRVQIQENYQADCKRSVGAYHDDMTNCMREAEIQDNHLANWTRGVDIVTKK